MTDTNGSLTAVDSLSRIPNPEPRPDRLNWRRSKQPGSYSPDLQTDPGASTQVTNGTSSPR